MDMPPTMQVIRSTDLLAIGYDHHEEELWVRFRTTPGFVYVYSAVPENLYRRLLSAPSRGRFFHTSIRNSFCVRKHVWRW